MHRSTAFVVAAIALLTSIAPTAASATRRVPNAVLLTVGASKERMAVRMSTRPRVRCRLTVSTKRRSAALPWIRTSSAGRATISWVVPRDAPGGRWAFTVRCRIGGATRIARTHVLVVTRGSGRGRLIEPSSGRLSGGAIVITEGKGAGGNVSCAPVLGGGRVCFTNDPFATAAYGLNTGECTWYANGRRPDLNGIVRHDAKRWLADARGHVPEGSVPVVGAIAVWTYGGGGYGHVAYVAGVADGGATVIVDEANYVRYHTVSLGRRVPAREISGYIYGGPAGNGPAPPPPPAPVAHNPDGHLDSASRVTGGQVRLVGWARDADAAGAAVTVRALVDGIAAGQATAGLARADVGAHGFDLAVPVDGRAHTICAQALNLGGGSDTILAGCAAIPALTSSGVFGDFDGDGYVGCTDVAILKIYYGRSGSLPEDLNGDGTVDLFDLSILLSNLHQPAGEGPCSG